MLEQECADAASLMVVENRERHLGYLRIVLTDVLADPDDTLLVAVTQRGDQSDVAYEIQFRKRRKVLIGQRAPDAEKAMVEGARAERTEVLEQSLLVVGTDRADMDRSSVAQHLVSGMAAPVGHARAV